MNSRVKKIRVILAGYQAGDRVRIINKLGFENQIVTLIRRADFPGVKGWIITSAGSSWCDERDMEPE